jgi:hypothetical protein
LKIVKKYKTAGNACCGTFIGMARCPFAALYAKRWMAPKYSICISSTGELVYKDYDDFQSITAVPSNENNAILIGGRNEVTLFIPKVKSNFQVIHGEFFKDHAF